MRKALLTIAMTLALTCPAGAMFMRPESVPVDRLERNITAYVKAHPKEPKGYYTLGRVHYLAVAAKTGTVGVYRFNDEKSAGKKLPDLANAAFQPRPDPNASPADGDEIRRHVKAAIENLRTAVSLDPKNGLYHLTLASILEATPAETAVSLGGFPPGDVVTKSELKPEDIAAGNSLIDHLSDVDDKSRAKTMDDLRALGAPAVVALLSHKDSADPEIRARIPQGIKSFWESRAAAEYATAFDYANPKDKQSQHTPLLGLGDLVSYEAGSHYLALTSRATDEPTNTKRTEILDAMTALEKLPPGPITPIVFSTTGAQSLNDLLSPTTHVPFDLDGTARHWTWPWVKPTTALLVWDPHNTGRITSGRQLFGTVTFGLIWNSGYDALASLDDNADGQLTGAELQGLSLWLDRNSDGISDSGEVTPLQDAGITALSVHPTTTDHRSPTHPQGLRMRDGRALPTWDWLTVPTARR